MGTQPMNGNWTRIVTDDWEYTERAGESSPSPATPSTGS